MQKRYNRLSCCLIYSFAKLSGWIGLSYNEKLRVSELPSSATPPVLYFSLSYGARVIALPLESLVLPELQKNSSSSGSGSDHSVRRLCIQRSSSIVQNGATIFAALNTDTGSVQRYRMQGSFSLPLYNMVQTPVVLGAMALEAIGPISVNGVNRSVAMTGRSSSALTTDDMKAGICASQQIECTGEQQYIESTNACKGKCPNGFVKVDKHMVDDMLKCTLDPDCSLYYFHSLDDSTKRCVMVRQCGFTTICILLTDCGLTLW